MSSSLSTLDKLILNSLQKGISIEERPFQELSQELGITEEEVANTVTQLLERGYLSRFGPLYNIEKFGGRFVLVALEAGKDDFERVNEIVNSYPEVAHNYERAHQLNMWFVLATETLEEEERILSEIKEKTGCTPLPMPKLEEYHLNLFLEVT